MATNSPRTVCVYPDTLASEREKRAWTQEHLAAEAGINLKTLRRIMAGKPAYWSTIRRIATALALDPAYLTAVSSPVNWEGYFELRLTTIGVLKTPEQLARLTNITQEIVTHIADAGIKIHLHDLTLSLPDDHDAGQRIVVRVDRVDRPRRRSTKTTKSGTVWRATPIPRPIRGDICESWTYLAIRPSQWDAFIERFQQDDIHRLCFPSRYGEIIMYGYNPTIPPAEIHVAVELSSERIPLPH